MAINKDEFITTLLNGYGSHAYGPFPSEEINDYEYDLEKAKQLLLDDGYGDSDNDGYLDKNGERLVIKYLTYPGRSELPLLATYLQARLKEIGIELVVNSTSNHLSELSNNDYDIYASALVASPTGDSEYFFNSVIKSGASKNYGYYSNREVDSLIDSLHKTYDIDERKAISQKINQILVDECALVYVSYLRMSIVCKSNVSGISAHPCDYYEITSELNIN